MAHLLERTRSSTSLAHELAAPAVLFVGAAAYALAEGPGGVTFYITPAAVGVIAILAGLASPQRSLIPSGLGVLGWGAAVLLVHYGTIAAGRATPAYMFGLVLGVVVASVVAPPSRRAAWTRASAVAALVGALYFYIEYGHPSLGRWPAYLYTLLAWGAWMVLRAVYNHRRASAPDQPAGVAAAA